MEQEYILTIDLGTGGPKVGLFTDTGDYIAHEFEPNTLNILPDGGAEQDPCSWWDTIKTAMNRLFEKNPINRENISALCCTSHWSGTVAVGKDGKHLANAINWMDSRGAKYIKKIVDGPLKVEGYSVFKVLKWLRLTGGAPGLAGKDPIAHILYIKNELPDLYNQTYKFLEPVDYLNLRLTGKFVASFDSITLHWVTDNRNINKVKYHDGLLRMAGIPREKLPDLIPSNSIVGNLSSEAAAELGLSTKTKVVAGCGDVHSAAVGSGAVQDFVPHFYIGTSSWLICHVPFKKTDIAHNMTTLPSPIPGRYFLANEQETSGACITFLRDNILFTKDEFTPDGPPADFHERLNIVAAKAPAGSGNLIFIPRLFGERSPVEDHYTRGGFFNLSLNHTRAHIVRSVMEGVAFNARWLLKYVEKNVDRQFDYVNIIGGGAKSELWCQIVADVFDRPVRQMKDPVAANSRGAAYLAAMAIGKLNPDEISKKVEVQKEFKPQPENRIVYDKLFKEFLKFYAANKKAFHRLNK